MAPQQPLQGKKIATGYSRQQAKGHEQEKTVVKSFRPSQATDVAQDRSTAAIPQLKQHCHGSAQSQPTDVPVVARIDHDPNDSTLSITLSPLGLKSFAAQNPDKK